MEKDRKKVREPYPPENTPRPPQIIDPEAREEQNKKRPDKPVNKGSEKKSKPDEKKGMLSDQADIHDETTI